MIIFVLAGTPPRALHLLPAAILVPAPETEEVLVSELTDEECKVLGRLQGQL